MRRPWHTGGFCAKLKKRWGGGGVFCDEMAKLQEHVLEAIRIKNVLKKLQSVSYNYLLTLAECSTK